MYISTRRLWTSTAWRRSASREAAAHPAYGSSARKSPSYSWQAVSYERNAAVASPVLSARRPVAHDRSNCSISVHTESELAMRYVSKRRSITVHGDATRSACRVRLRATCRLLRAASGPVLGQKTSMSTSRDTAARRCASRYARTLRVRRLETVSTGAPSMLTRKAPRKCAVSTACTAIGPPPLCTDRLVPVPDTTLAGRCAAGSRRVRSGYATDDAGLGTRMATAAGLADELLDALFEAYPLWATLLGFRERDDRLTDYSEAGDEAVRTRVAAIAARALDADMPGPADRVTGAVVLQQAEAALDRVASRAVEYTVTDYGMAAAVELLWGLSMVGIAEPAHADGYLVRLGRIPQALGAIAERHRAGIAAGRLPVRHLVDAAISHLDRYLDNRANDPLRRPRALADGRMNDTAFHADRDRLLDEVVRPAVAGYREVVAAEVLPHGRSADRAGLCWLPGGEATYARLVRLHTTTDRSPQDLHRTGMEIIAGLAEEYAVVGSAAFGTRDLGEIFTRLRTDPALRWKDADELLADEMGLYSDAVARLGMLNMDSMRAARLVVDTGLHSEGWRRQQAVDYMRTNTALTPAQVDSEVDRYIADPAQALAYMVGRLEQASGRPHPPDRWRRMGPARSEGGDGLRVYVLVGLCRARTAPEVDPARVDAEVHAHRHGGVVADERALDLLTGGSGGDELDPRIRGLRGETAHRGPADPAAPGRRVRVVQPDAVRVVGARVVGDRDPAGNHGDRREELVAAGADLRRLAPASLAALRLHHEDVAVGPDRVAAGVIRTVAVIGPGDPQLVGDAVVGGLRVGVEPEVLAGQLRREAVREGDLLVAEGPSTIPGGRHHDRVVVLCPGAGLRRADRRRVRDVQRAVPADLAVGALSVRRDAALEAVQRRGHPGRRGPRTPEVRRLLDDDRRLHVLALGVVRELGPRQVDRAAVRVGGDPLLVVEDVGRRRCAVRLDPVQLDD